MNAGTRALRLRAPLATVAVAAAGAAYLGTVDPNEPGHYPVCPFLQLTELYCPGCGSLRAIHALAHARVTQAVDSNALLVLVALPLLAVLWGRWVWRLWHDRPRANLAPPWRLWALSAGVVIFSVVRNLPWGAGLAP